jgi:hypothetical protein
MTSLPRNGITRRRLAFAAIILGCVLAGLGAANLFPDQTWQLLNTARTLYAGLVSRLTPIPSGTDRNLQESSIYESLVRDDIGSNRWSNRVFFLSVDGSDPSDELMIRLRASGLAINRASEAHYDRTKSGLTGRWIDQRSGRSAVQIDVGSIRWLFGDRVEVKSGLSCGPLCGGGGIYQLVKTQSRWAVAACRNRWMS